MHFEFRIKLPESKLELSDLVKRRIYDLNPPPLIRSIPFTRKKRCVVRSALPREKTRWICNDLIPFLIVIGTLECQINRVEGGANKWGVWNYLKINKQGDGVQITFEGGTKNDVYFQKWELFKFQMLKPEGTKSCLGVKFSSKIRPPPVYLALKSTVCALVFFVRK